MKTKINIEINILKDGEVNNIERLSASEGGGILQEDNYMSADVRDDISKEILIFQIV